MPATWPLTLPQALLLAGNNEAMADGRLLSRTDTGPGKRRRRSTATSRPFGGAMHMTEAQVTILEGFVDVDLAEGTLPFNFPAARGAGVWLCRFGDVLPSWVELGPDRWRVTLSLEVLR